MSIAVIGAGKWGSALFHAFSENNECVISSRTPREMPNFVSLEEALECEYLVCTIPTQATNLWLKQNYKNKGQKILVASKGIDLSLIHGAEVCGAYKNVIAIAGGICDGLGLGNNARASLISRGLVEMARFGKFFGAKDETFMGLSGAGDLFLTASSILSRNYRVGLGIARHERLEKILNELGEVAEGVDTARAISKIAKEKGIYVPIASEVENMLNGKDVFESVKSLLGRR